MAINPQISKILTKLANYSHFLQISSLSDCINLYPTSCAMGNMTQMATITTDEIIESDYPLIDLIR